MLILKWIILIFSGSIISYNYESLYIMSFSLIQRLSRGSAARRLLLGSSAATVAGTTCLVANNTGAAESFCSASTNTSISANPLLSQGGVPKFAEIRSTDVVPAIQIQLKELRDGFTVLESELTRDRKPSYASVIEKLEVIQAPLSYSWGVTGHLMGYA